MSAIIGSTPSPQGESNGYAVVCHGNRKLKMCGCREPVPGVDLGGGCRGCTHPPPPEMTCGFLIQLVFCKKRKKKTMWFIGVEVEQETSAPPPKKILDPPLRLL